MVLEWLTENCETICKVLRILLFVLVSFVLFLKTKDNKYLKEVLEMFKRTPDYQEKEEKKGQEFERFVKTYRLNQQTNELEEDGEVDIVELVNSCKDVAIDNILERFMPVMDATSDEVVEYDAMRDDLDLLRESYSVAEEYREKYGLPADYSALQVISAVQEKAQELKSKIAQNEKGGTENEETQDVEKSEPKDIPSDGE